MASSCYDASQHNQKRLRLRPKQDEFWHHHVMTHLSVIKNGWDETQTGGIVASSCYVASQRNQERLGMRPKQEELWHHHVMTHLSIIKNG